MSERLKQSKSVAQFKINSSRLLLTIIHKIETHVSILLLAIFLLLLLFSLVSLGWLCLGVKVVFLLLSRLGNWLHQLIVKSVFFGGGVVFWSKLFIYKITPCVYIE